LIQDQYIVVYRDEITDVDFAQDIASISQQVPLIHTYQHALKGYAANFTAAQLASVRQNPLVKFVEQDQVMRAVACGGITTGALNWGLTRISERKVSLDGRYQASTTGGSGVTNYIVDTGILLTHTEFATGRATFGFKATSTWSNTDGNGHGTHVSSTVAGVRYGVAKSSVVVAVKVLGDDGSGSNAGVVAGVDWVVAQYRSVKKLSTINMSLGGGFSAATNTAVNNAVTTGIVTVVAAGNSNTDACSSSPASAANVLTVGATSTATTGGVPRDIRSSFSNYGSCTKIFAPGTLIPGAWIGGNSNTNTISGTSMASPHVCGIAALYLAENPNVIATSAQTAIRGQATPGEIDLLCSNTVCNASPNLLANNFCTKAR